MSDVIHLYLYEIIEVNAMPNEIRLSSGKLTVWETKIKLKGQDFDAIPSMPNVMLHKCSL